MHEVWGWEFGDLSTVTVHVRRLRGKIETDPAKPALIRTVWGVGYRFEAEPDAPLPETRPQVPSAVADPPAVNDALATSAQAGGIGAAGVAMRVVALASGRRRMRGPIWGPGMGTGRRAEATWAVGEAGGGAGSAAPAG